MVKYVRSIDEIQKMVDIQKVKDNTKGLIKVY